MWTTYIYFRIHVKPIFDVRKISRKIDLLADLGETACASKGTVECRNNGIMKFDLKF